jgi:nicotinamidase-related amidase
VAQRQLAAARRLLDGARAHGAPIIHIRLAVRPDYRDVVQNGALFRQWVELNAWQEDAWGVEFHEGLEPVGDELIVTHIRKKRLLRLTARDAGRHARRSWAPR